jgi:hypothetical protein
MLVIMGTEGKPYRRYEASPFARFVCGLPMRSGVYESMRVRHFEMLASRLGRGGRSVKGLSRFNSGAEL